MSSAVTSLLIFGICLILFVWNRIPQAVTALCGITIMVLLGVCSFSSGFRYFGSETVLLISAMMVVGKASFQTGLAQTIGHRVLAMAGNSERKLVLFGTAITAVISAFLSNIATLSIMIYMVTGICITNRQIKFRNLIMPISVGAVLGGVATLIGSTPQLTAQGLLESYLGEGNGFTFFTFSVPGVLIILATVLYAGFIGYPLGKKIWGARPDHDLIPSVHEVREEQELHTEKKGIMAVIFAVTVLLFMLNQWIVRWIPGMNLAAVSLLSACACVLTGCIRPKDAVSSINWNLVIWLSASLGMAAAVNASGGGELIAQMFMCFVDPQTPPAALFALVVILTVVLTHFLANSTAITIVFPIAFSLVTELGYQFFPFAVGITMASSVAIGTPIANTTIAMSVVARYEFRDYWRYSLPLIAIATVIILVVVPLQFPLV